MLQMREGRATAIREAIKDLYVTAGEPVPSVDRCVVPLYHLISSFNLVCVELPKLTSQRAMEFLMQRGGIIEPFDGALNKPLAGFLYATANLGSIFVEASDMVVRRRFSAAHELGHWLLHFRPLLTETIEDGTPAVIEVAAMDTGPSSFGEQNADELPMGEFSICGMVLGSKLPVPIAEIEREANAFAGELLMPEELVLELASKYLRYSGIDDLIGRLAADMLVSRAAMRWRIRELGMFAPASNGATMEK
jgi:Zn-dependent peptidase ImmA (M78 family)